jgi:nitrogen fixation NifU-like protein
MSGGESPAAVKGLPYSDVIRRRWRHPEFRGRLSEANAAAEDVNPLCGDRVRMELRVEGDAVVAARFSGDSCAICTASADVVSELVTGKSVRDARKLETPDVLEILDADVRPTRLSCVTLPLGVMRMALGGTGRTS